MALTQRLFASRSLLTPVVLYGSGGRMEPTALILIIDGGFGQFSLTMVLFDGGGGGMEPTAPIDVVDGGVGSLCQRRLLSTDSLVG